MTVERFKNIFQGLNSAYGQYVSKVSLTNGEKVQGKAFIKKAAIAPKKVA